MLYRYRPAPCDTSTSKLPIGMQMFAPLAAGLLTNWLRSTRVMAGRSLFHQRTPNDPKKNPSPKKNPLQLLLQAPAPAPAPAPTDQISDPPAIPMTAMGSEVQMQQQ